MVSLVYLNLGFLAMKKPWGDPSSRGQNFVNAKPEIWAKIMILIYVDIDACTV